MCIELKLNEFIIFSICTCQLYYMKSKGSHTDHTPTSTTTAEYNSEFWLHLQST